jgi:hypothetical protein
MAGVEPEPEGRTTERARAWILAIGVAYLALVVLYTVAVGDLRVADDVRLPLLVLAAIQLGLWVWAGTAPLHASVAALAVFVLANGYQAVVDPDGLRWMILVRVVFLLGLIKSVHAGALARRAAALPGARLVKR